MTEEKLDRDDILLAHTAQAVSAYVSTHQVSKDELTDLISMIYQGFKDAHLREDSGSNEPAPEPAVPIDQSLSDDVLICLEDGLPFQSLKRHLRVKYNMTPEAYRKKWGLPIDYPMVAPNYAKRRSALAKRSGLGKSRG